MNEVNLRLEKRKARFQVHLVHLKKNIKLLVLGINPNSKNRRKQHVIRLRKLNRLIQSTSKLIEIKVPNLLTSMASH